MAHHYMISLLASYTLFFLHSVRALDHHSTLYIYRGLLTVLSIFISFQSFVPLDANGQKPMVWRGSA